MNQPRIQMARMTSKIQQPVLDEGKQDQGKQA